MSRRGIARAATRAYHVCGHVRAVAGLHLIAIAMVGSGSEIYQPAKWVRRGMLVIGGADGQVPRFPLAAHHPSRCVLERKISDPFGTLQQWIGNDIRDARRNRASRLAAFNRAHAAFFKRPSI
ncbi:MAG: hypothetical protein ACLP8B_05150 [Xanthobacteraceae bacterium]